MGVRRSLTDDIGPPHNFLQKACPLPWGIFGNLFNLVNPCMSYNEGSEKKLLHHSSRQLAERPAKGLPSISTWEMKMETTTLPLQL
jgi:hypothetical protein